MGDTSRIKIGIVGLGKIAHDQHVPALRSTNAYELAGVADIRTQLSGVPSFSDLDSLVRGVPALAAVSLCTPPQIRCQIARDALQRGLHVFLEKPPGVSVTEVQALAALAEASNLTLFASWHSRFAPAVETARAWVLKRQVRQVEIHWKEDVRTWHPGQQWIWRAGGLGVFDPGINALSILTRVISTPIALQGADLHIPSNCDTPIAARLSMTSSHGAPIHAQFDFRQQGPQNWDISIATDQGTLLLSLGGRCLHIDGRPVKIDDVSEYSSLYKRFAELVRNRCSDVDLSPLQLVADALLCGRRIEEPPFFE